VQIEYQYQALAAYVEEEFLTKNAAEVPHMDNPMVGETVSSLSDSFSTASVQYRKARQRGFKSAQRRQTGLAIQPVRARQIAPA